MLRGCARKLSVLSLAAAGTWLTAATAQAATTYYVAPDGPSNSAPCEKADPCYLGVPLTKGLESGDTVILASGEYQPPPGLPLGITVNLLHEHVTVEGEPGEPPPRIFSKVSGGPAVRMEGFQAVLANLVIEDSGTESEGWPSLIVDDAAEVDHVIVRSTTNERAACSGYAVAFTDSVCAGRYGFYVSTFGAVAPIDLRNSVFYGTEYGMVLVGTGELDLEADAVNSVIRAAPGGTDILSEPFEAKGVVHLALEHSNFGLIVEGGAGQTLLSDAADQSASPLFVNAAGGDFREAPASPTIDAGLDSPLNGLTDLAGNPREIGAHTDIGAYEFLIPPSVETGAASGVGATSATVAGSVNANGLASSAQFRYGTSTAYGTTVSLPSPGAGTSPAAVSAALTGLAPGTTYHYELLATTAEGASAGGDRTFTTASAFGAHPGLLPPPRGPVLANLRVSPASLRAARHGPSATNAPAARSHTGATVTYTLSEAAQVSFTIEENRPGRRGRAGRCVAPTRSDRHARPCRRTLALGRFSRSGSDGSNRFHLTGALPHGPLAPGSYVLLAAPKAAGLTGAARRAGFRVHR